MTHFNWNKSLMFVVLALVAITAGIASNLVKNDGYQPPVTSENVQSIQAGDFVFMTTDNPMVQTASISGQYMGTMFYNQPVEYVMIDGLPIFQGDIVLDLRQEPVRAGMGVSMDRYLWPDGLIPYRIDPKLTNQERITKAIAHWEKHTSIRFVERTAANARQYPSYVSFIPARGCWSYVGRIGGQQQIGLAPGCGLTATIHEIGHAVGLWHEQSRNDRDEYVTIHFENIISGMEHNFNKQAFNGLDIGEYDYGSIMHYPRWAFSKNGKDTIVPKIDVAIGEATVLSDEDIAAVEHMYGN